MDLFKLFKQLSFNNQGLTLDSIQANTIAIIAAETLIVLMAFFSIIVFCYCFLLLRRYDFSSQLKIRLINSIVLRNSNKANLTDKYCFSTHPFLGPLFTELKYPYLKNARLESRRMIQNFNRKIKFKRHALDFFSTAILAIGVSTSLLVLLFDVYNYKLENLSLIFIPATLSLFLSLTIMGASLWLKLWRKRIFKDIKDILSQTRV